MGGSILGLEQEEFGEVHRRSGHWKCRETARGPTLGQRSMEQEECRACSLRGLHSNGARLRATPICLDGLNARKSVCLGTHRHTYAHSNGSAGTRATSGTNTAYQSPKSSQTAHSNMMTSTKARKKMKRKNACCQETRRSKPRDGKRQGKGMDWLNTDNICHLAGLLQTWR